MIRGSLVKNKVRNYLAFLYILYPIPREIIWMKMEKRVRSKLLHCRPYTSWVHLLLVALLMFK